ncbi:MAG TPA: hypothetical protein VJ183_01660 [Chloroflexia bacterium]|nr:hypothetical protein [Chloroflexia bacterium]
MSTVVTLDTLPMEMGATRQVTGTITEDLRSSLLNRVGGAAALITAVLIPSQVIVMAAWPPPLDGTAIDWFTLFRDNWLLGLLSLDLLFMIDYALLAPIFLALYGALRRVNQSLMLLGTALGFVAIAAYFASNTAFEMLSLSNQYANATTDAARSTFLAAGQAMFATYQGTAFHVSYVLGSIAGIVISAVMLRGFSKVAAYAGILGNVIGFGLYLPTIGIFLGVISGPILWIWYILIARKLFQLGRSGSKALPEQS